MTRGDVVWCMMGDCLIGCFMFLLFFFFKQKTAYEIYQCDWSSDVCSSDLRSRVPAGPPGFRCY